MNSLKPGPMTEWNVQFNLALRLREYGFDILGENVPPQYPANRFDLVILRNRKVVAIVETKNYSPGQVESASRAFYGSPQYARYRHIAETHGILLKFCAGFSEVERVAKEIKRHFTPWWGRWMV